MADAELEEVCICTTIFQSLSLAEATHTCYPILEEPYLTLRGMTRSEKPALRNCRRKEDKVEDQAKVQIRNRDTEARQAILSQILLPEAADRLGRIRLVKEERATDIENRLIMLARTGQLRAKVTEEQLKELLNAVAENKEEEKIVISRRKGGWDDDDLLGF
ncbi:hypothetical protein ACJ73_00014 [Blastomyces percursus]|uniref:Programmed cell death protein 5 n=1 Tax=Blastomyces percursus TaxID=1658174 RepID=A0A1J9RLV2_9EURO|nr:hypothetical protein ACJ73_00014 [Blastomyces percursus]